MWLREFNICVWLRAKEMKKETRPVHESVWVGFVPNPIISGL